MGNIAEAIMEEVVKRQLCIHMWEVNTQCNLGTDWGPHLLYTQSEYYCWYLESPEQAELASHNCLTVCHAFCRCRLFHR